MLYYCQDANFNTTALVNTSGTVVERYVYDPYGKPTVLDGDWSSDADGQSDYANEILCGGWSADWTGGLCPANPAGRGSGRENSIVSPELPDMVGGISAVIQEAAKSDAAQFRKRAAEQRAAQRRACLSYIIPYCCPAEARKHCAQYIHQGGGT